MSLPCFFFLALLVHSCAAGCCNQGYWCDGDPRFLEKPDIVQGHNSPFISVSWTDNYIDKGKCVDYFYVEVRDDSKANASFVKYPVFYDQKEVLDDWQDPIKTPKHKYWANVSVTFDTTYTIRAAGVDRGGDLEDNEGESVAFSEDVLFHTRPFSNRTIAEISSNFQSNITFDTFDSMFPPTHCSRKSFCKELALAWIKDVIQEFLSRHLRYHDPVFLPNIDMTNIGDDLGTHRLYEQGRLHHLSSSRAQSVILDPLDNDLLRIKVNFTVRLFRISYFWDSFFTSGILSAYHTCGNDLPTAFFEDVDEEEVDEVVPKDCGVAIAVTLTVPTKLDEQKLLFRSKVNNVSVSLERQTFKYDTTWFTQHFHDLDLMFEQQQRLVEPKVKKVFRHGMSKAIKVISPKKWTDKQYEKKAAVQEQ